jgi:hypothetical protein
MILDQTFISAGCWLRNWCFYLMCMLQCRVRVVMFLFLASKVYLLHIYCDVLWSLDHFWTPVVQCYATVDAVLIVNFFITIPITRNYNHNYFSRCATFTQLTIYTFVTTITYYTGWLLRYKLLSQIITDSTSSHFETLAENLFRVFTS